MASRTLRSKTVKPSQRDDVFTLQEGECEWPHHQPELSDNDTELGETTQLSLVEANRATDTEAKMTRTNTITNGEKWSEKFNADGVSELKIMLASVLTTLETSYKELQNK
jgi:hypothetical protein